VLALLYVFVPDYKTVAMAAGGPQVRQPAGTLLQRVAGALTSSRTLWWTCLGAAFQLIVVSTIWSWLPSYLNRYHGTPPDRAAMQAALVVLCGALGAFVWGVVADVVAARRQRNRLIAVAVLAVVTLLVFMTAFGTAMPANQQFLLIAFGGFLMTCTVAPASSVVFDVVHPGVRSTGAAVLSLFQNLFGLAIGPFVGGAMSDAWGLQTALAVMPIFGVVAAGCFLLAARSYEAELKRVANVSIDAAPTAAPAAVASA
jgi:sugar phosphate permease